MAQKYYQKDFDNLNIDQINLISRFIDYEIGVDYEIGKELIEGLADKNIPPQYTSIYDISVFELTEREARMLGDYVKQVKEHTKFELKLSVIKSEKARAFTREMAKNGYYLFSFPEYQEFMDESWFDEECSYDVSSNQYFIPIIRVLDK